MTLFARRVFVSSLLVCLAGCGTRGPTYVTQLDVKAAAGAVVTVTPQESPQLAGTQISVPAGALAADTTITVAFQSADIVPATGEAAGPVAVLGPSGTTFSSPVTLSLPYTLSGSDEAEDLYMYLLEDDGSSQLVYPPDLTVNTSTGMGSIQISSFTRFEHGAHHCSAGETHCHGQCVDLSSDTNHCGTCNTVCGAEQVCSNHSCVNPDGGTPQDGGSQDGGSIVDGGATQLVFLTAPQTLDAGACSLAATIQFEDGAGDVVVTGQQRVVSVFPSTQASIFLGAGCTQITQYALVVPGDAGSATFSFKGLISGPLQWTASATGVDAATQIETIR